MEITRRTSNEIETKKLGEILGNRATEGMVFTLTGDLGAGKTTLSKGIAKGLGVQKTVTSPTFTICKIYQGRMPLYHFDAYRLEGSSDDLGFDEMIEGDGLSLVEWPEYMRELLPEEILEIKISLLENGDRLFSFRAKGSRYENLLKEVLR